MTAIRGVNIETLHNPIHYTCPQLERVCEIAHKMDRGRFVLVEAPMRQENDEDE